MSHICGSVALPVAGWWARPTLRTQGHGLQGMRGRSLRACAAAFLLHPSSEARDRAAAGALSLCRCCGHRQPCVMSVPLGYWLFCRWRVTVSCSCGRVITWGGRPKPAGLRAQAESAKEAEGPAPAGDNSSTVMPVLLHAIGEWSSANAYLSVKHEST
jgi:hypothetical protein